MAPAAPPGKRRCSLRAGEWHRNAFLPGGAAGAMARVNGCVPVCLCVRCWARITMQCDPCSARARVRTLGAEGDTQGDAASADALPIAPLDAARRRQAAKEAFISAARAGPKNGVFATAQQRTDIEGKLVELIKLNPTPQPAAALLRPPFPFFDGTFSLLYTNTTGGFSGKLGPLVGDVSQTFEGVRDSEDALGLQRRGVFGGGGLFGGRKPGCIFSNTAKFGELGISVRARCEAKTESKLSIYFEQLSLSLFGVRAPFSKTFEEGGRGTRWTLQARILKSSLSGVALYTHTHTHTLFRVIPRRLRG